MKKIMIFILLIIPALLHAQDTLSLERCLRAAGENHPRQADYRLLDDISGNKLENIQTRWYPDLNLNGSATYQSDVIRLDIDSPIPGIAFPVPPKDQYKVSLDISQTLYDAGMTKKQREVEKAGLQTSLVQLQSEIEKEKDVVKDIFFNLLLLQENKKITSLSLTQLESGRDVVRSGVENGMRLTSDLDLIRVEIMKLQQNISELQFRREAFLRILSAKTGIMVSSSDSLVLTDYDVPDSAHLQRTELELFSLKRDELGKSAGLLDSKRLPVLYAFGQFGYGKPGLNLLNNQFDTYYIIGAGLKWNLWDWNQVKREKANLQMQSEMILHQRNNFEENVDEALIRQMSEIRSHAGNIAKFTEILSVREKITATYRSQLENGTLRINDFLEVLNGEKKARIELATEKILLQKAVADYKYIEGSL